MRTVNRRWEREKTMSKTYEYTMRPDGTAPASNALGIRSKTHATRQARILSDMKDTTYRLWRRDISEKVWQPLGYPIDERVG